MGLGTRLNTKVHLVRVFLASQPICTYKQNMKKHYEYSDEFSICIQRSNIVGCSHAELTWSVKSQFNHTFTHTTCSSYSSYMVDSADHEKIDASKNELHSLLDKPQLAGIPVRYFLYPSPPPLFFHPRPILIFSSPFLSPNTLLSPPCSLSLYLLSTSSYPILFCPPPSFSSHVVSSFSSSLP